MSTVSIVTLIGPILILVQLFGGVILQIYLSTRKNKYLGLIIPGITFSFSLLMIANFFMIGANVSEMIITIGMSFIYSNISTFILLGIYFICRYIKFNKNKVDKMNIQDL
ncbi:hypothetical protein [Clostridium sp. B9]|uniref:hypothetical protein n=1 Tax=Clostridium sp. B9 TaxID=3423224 RepID=UPI003D2EB8B7